MGTPFDWKYLNTMKKYQFHFRMFVVILGRINNYTRNYSRLTPNYDSPSYTSRDEEEEEEEN